VIFTFLTRVVARSNSKLKSFALKTEQNIKFVKELTQLTQT